MHFLSINCDREINSKKTNKLDKVKPAKRKCLDVLYLSEVTETVSLDRCRTAYSEHRKDTEK